MVSAAEIVGESIRAVHRADGPALEAHDTAFNVTFLLGGQIRGGELRLFQIYSAGNFIEAMEMRVGRGQAIAMDAEMIDDGLAIGHAHQ